MHNTSVCRRKSYGSSILMKLTEIVQYKRQVLLVLLVLVVKWLNGKFRNVFSITILVKHAYVGYPG